MWIRILGLVVGAFVLVSLVERLRRRYQRGPAPTWANIWLDSPLRRWIDPVNRFLAWGNFLSGQVVLEIGPGPGYFTPHIARQVAAQGCVVALDINALLLRRALSAVQRVGLSALVHGVRADALALPLGGDRVDRALLVTVSGEISDRMVLFRELHRVLRPGGMVLIGEVWSDPGFSPSSRIQAWAAAAGFTAVQRYGRPWHYALLLRKEGN